MKHGYLLLFLLLFSFGIQGQSSKSIDQVFSAYNDYRYAQALINLREVPSEERVGFRYYMVSAKVYQANMYSDSARFYYQKAAEADSLALAPLIKWAQLEKGLQKLDRSIAAYRLAMARDAENAYLYRQLGELYMQKNQAINAISNYQKAIELQPNDYQSRIKLCKIYIDQQTYEMADNLCRSSLERDSTLHQFWQLSCLSAFRQKNYNLAWVCGDLAFQYGADSSSTMLRIMGMTAYHTLQLEKAHLLLVRSLLSGDESEKIFFYLGQIASEEEEPARAEAYFQKAIEAGTSEALGVYELHLGFSLDDQEKYAEAIPHYQTAYQITNEKVILYYLARDYDEAYRDKDLALTYYQKFLDEAGSEYYEYREYSENRISELKKIQHFRAEEG